MLWGDVSASERKVCEWILKQKGLGLKKRDSIVRRGTWSLRDCASALIVLAQEIFLPRQHSDKNALRSHTLGRGRKATQRSRCWTGGTRLKLPNQSTLWRRDPVRRSWEVKALPLKRSIKDLGESSKDDRGPRVYLLGSVSRPLSWMSTGAGFVPDSYPEPDDPGPWGLLERRPTVGEVEEV